MNKGKRIISISLCLIIMASSVVCTKTYAATKAKYVTKTNKYVIKDKKTIRGLVTYEYPALIGTSKAVNRINKTLESEAKKYIESDSVKNLEELTLEAISEKRFSDYDNSSEYYFYETTCKVTYNSKSVISIAMMYSWYAGGVHNVSEYGYTFSLKTGKMLSITDVVKGTDKEVRSKIISGAKKFLKKELEAEFDEVWSSVNKILNNYDLNSIKFYLTNGKANICFDCYELDLGNYSQVYTITSTYK